MWLLQGGHVWFLGGGVHGFFHEIRSMSGRYASYWNTFLFIMVTQKLISLWIQLIGLSILGETRGLSHFRGARYARNE